VHWGIFSLATHAWDEPAEALLALAATRRQPLLMPRLGNALEPAYGAEPRPWWRMVDRGGGVEVEAVPAEPVSVAKAMPLAGRLMPSRVRIEARWRPITVLRRHSAASPQRSLATPMRTSDCREFRSQRLVAQ
jgi:hypothetical protein